MGEGTGLGMGLGRGDFKRPLDDFRVGSSRACAAFVPLVGAAGMRNSGLTTTIVWQVREIFREDLQPDVKRRVFALCFPLDTPPLPLGLISISGGGVSLARHWSRIIRTNFSRSSDSGLGSWKRIHVKEDNFRII